MLFEYKISIELPKPKLCNGCDFLKPEAKKLNCVLGCSNTRKDDTDKFLRGEDCVLTLAQAEEKAAEAPASEGVITASFLRERMLANIEMATNAILKDVQTAILEAEQKYMFVTTVSVGMMPRPAWDSAIQKLVDAGYEAEYIVDQQGGDFVQVSWLPPLIANEQATPCEKQDFQESSELG